MVVLRLKTLRVGIAMIELIFAIVIMGIALLSVPMILSTATKSSILSLQQEAIAIAATHTNALLTYAWDEQNTESKTSYVQNILHTNTTTAMLTEVGRGTLSFAAARNRTFDPAGFASVSLGKIGEGNVTDPDEDDDVDDFNGVDKTMTLIAGGQNTSDVGEYVDSNVTLSTSVMYANDNTAYDASPIQFDSSTLLATPGGNTTFIKYISTQLTSLSASNSSELSKDIRLRAFMCNVGAAKPERRGGY